MVPSPATSACSTSIIPIFSWRSWYTISLRKDLLYVTASYHFTKPSENLTSNWWRNILNKKLSRLKIINLVSFLIENENFIKPEYEQNNTSGVDSSSDSETFYPATKQTRSQTSMIQQE
ncbi:hypothetical protein AVEN_47751-1 [Araneus ventricosus]|uniref:Uncharacterized protein n=1 Tax=Araneus ventricosus TaxID=182803 RepID=A0A4Y2K595_ARAVE|nr:hypothetical protein AVEN_47751-1 [Araneus ventricosus]